MNKAMKLNSFNELCSIFQLGKSHIFPFKKFQVKSLKPFDIVHVDLWGPSSINSVHNMRYLLLFVDDCISLYWLYVLSKKGQIFGLFFLHFEAMVSRQFGVPIKQLQSDGGTEFNSLET